MQSATGYPDISIEDVNLQKDTSRVYMEGKAQIVITLKNNSKTSAYHVLRRPGHIDYDKGSCTLTIDLWQKELPADAKSDSMPLEPERIAILPSATLRWQYLLPLWMKKITRPAGSREVVDVLDISGVQHVVCQLGERVVARFERRLSNS